MFHKGRTVTYSVGRVRYYLANPADRVRRVGPPYITGVQREHYNSDQRDEVD